MANRIRGNIKEFDFKEYGPEDAGQKIGWTTLEPNPDNESFYLRGAYATVGQDGAAVQIVEEVNDGTRLWRTGMTRGLSRACSYAILIDPTTDTRIMNSDHANVDLNDADYLAGRVYHMTRDIDDEQVMWGKGEPELTQAIKDVLGANELSDSYPYAYLTLNGRLGHQLYWQRRNDVHKPNLVDLTEVQLYDPEMSDVALDEQRKAMLQNEMLNKWGVDAESITLDADRGDLDAELFERFRERVQSFHDRIEEVRQSMIAPIVSYTREGFVRTWPFMSVTDFNREMASIEDGNQGVASLEVQREAEEVRARQRHVLQGAYILYALTANGRKQANSNL